jgi:hypothetical protein
VIKQVESLEKAASFITQAMKLLDDASAPEDIAARLDHAYSRLEALLAALRDSDDSATG